MVVKAIVFSLGVLFFITSVYSREGYKDPFDSFLPEETVEELREDAPAEETEAFLPEFTVEGILWGGNFPQAIINGEVYRVGDRLGGAGDQVFKIERNTVFIYHKEKIYKLQAEKAIKE